MKHLDALEMELDVASAGAGRPWSLDESGRGSHGSELAEQLGYQQAELATVPTEVLSSFAGVGYHFDVASVDAGCRVLDVGCGSGTDTFVAAWHTGDDGRVVGVDERRNPVETAHGIATRDDRDTVAFDVSHLDALPFEAGTFDLAISNGVIHRHAAKDRVFREIHRVLKPRGRLVLADVVSEERFPEWIESAADLRADCVGGAMEEAVYVDAIEAAGFDVEAIRTNAPYEAIADQPSRAWARYGVKSVSLLGRRRPRDAPARTETRS